MAINEVVARLSVLLGLDTAAFSTGSARAQKQATGLQKGLQRIGTAAKAMGAALSAAIGSAIVGEFRQAGRAALDAAGGLGEAASAAGVTTKALQELRYYGTQVNLTNEDVDKSLAMLTRRLGEAGQGVKEPAKALDVLGVKLRDSNGRIRATDVVLQDIADAMQEVDDPATRAALATDLFGRAGQKLMPLLEGGAAGIRKYADEANRLGVVLSEQAIAKADELADKLAAQERVLEMRRTAMFVENAEAVATTETLWQDAQLKMFKTVAGIVNFFAAWRDSAAALQRTIDGIDAKINDAFSSMWHSFEAWWERTKATGHALIATFAAIPGQVIAAMRKMVAGVGEWLGARLSAAVDGARKKIDEVKGWFFDLYDAVVGNSYVPDMVDEIGQHMRRLDKELVEPATTATTKAAAAFRDLQQQVAGILARLFPEQDARLTFEKEMASLDAYHKAGRLSAAEHAAAVEALRREYAGLDRDRTALAPGDADPRIESVLGGKSIEEISAQISERFGDAMDRLAEKSGVVKTQVVKSFKDMADETLSALNRLSGAIRGGGFLSILEGVIGLGLQLGGLGLFGKKIQANLAKIPGNANGTSFWRGGLTWVGERGPELVNLPRGAGVTPNNKLGGIGGMVEIRPSPYFDVVVDGRIVRASPAIMDGSARVTTARAGRRQMRRLA